MMKKIISLILAILMLVSVVPINVSASTHKIVMTSNEFINYLKEAALRDNIYSYQGYPYNLGYYDGSVISWDCWNLGKSIIWTNGEIVNNYTTGNFARPNTSCGLGDWTGFQIMENTPNSNSDFTKLVPGEWLYMETTSGQHMGYFIGDGQVIECTDSWGVNGITYSQIDSNGTRSRNGAIEGKWLSHGMVPWIDYTVSSTQIGDTIEFGSYLGETITWICVDVDENGPLMLSRDVLCNKQYDAAGTDSNYHNDGWGYIRKNYGSNCWYDSNIRQWLNSSGTVKYTHCPPTYSNEDGFMSNFSEAELACVKEVTQKTYVNSWETNRSGYVNGGTREVPDVTTVAGLDRDYSYYWYQNVTDSFFLLGQEQLSRIYENNPSYVYNDASYYTRIAGNSGASYEHTFVVFGENTIGASRSSSSNGIRPAFYLDIDKYNSSTNTPSTPQTCKHTNSVNQPQINSNCIDIGFTAGVYCNDCATWLSGHDVIAVGDHKDNTGDGRCDTCLKQLSTNSQTEQPKKNIVQKVVDAVKNAFNNFINFFKKLFGR